MQFSIISTLKYERKYSDCCVKKTLVKADVLIQLLVRKVRKFDHFESSFMLAGIDLV